MANASPTAVSAAINAITAAALATPVNAAFSTATTGGTLAAGTYYYRVSATNSAGETLASTETSIVTTGTTSTVTVNWGAVTGATGYRVYGRSTGAELFIASTTTATTYTDTGSVTPAGALPAANTTAFAGFASLHTATPGTTGASESASTTRQAAAWSTSSAGSNSSNTGAITWTTPGTTAVTYFGTWSASTAGNYNIGGALSSSVTAATITAAVGALVISAS